MSVDKLVDSTQLDSDLTSVANAIRAKGETSASLAFPADFSSAINAMTVLHEYSGNLVSFSTASAKNLRRMTIPFTYSQAGSGDPAPSNVRPISGRADVNIYVSPTLDPGDGSTYTVGLDGTRYSGTLDVTTGVLTLDMAELIFNGTQQIQLINWRSTQTSVGVGYAAAIAPNVSKPPLATPTTAIADKLKSISYNNAYDGVSDAGLAVMNAAAYSFILRLPDPTLTTVALVNAYLASNPITVVYPVVTPIAVQLTPTQVGILAGANNVWSDAGDVSFEYVT